MRSQLAFDYAGILVWIEYVCFWYHGAVRARASNVQVFICTLYLLLAGLSSDVRGNSYHQMCEDPDRGSRSFAVAQEEPLHLSSLLRVDDPFYDALGATLIGVAQVSAEIVGYLLDVDIRASMPTMPPISLPPPRPPRVTKPSYLHSSYAS